jgi:peptide deformylase
MKIVQEHEHPALRVTSEKVPAALFGSTELAETIRQMFALLKAEDDGVAIAAPQIGIAKQIFVIAPKVAKTLKENHLVYINPKITKCSQEKKYMDEGCLSVRWLYGQVLRHTRVTITAYDENGVKFQRGAGGLLAHIFQHETDHLAGRLFIDTAINITKLSDDDIVALQNNNTKNNQE